jgi:hypothetical protein
MMEIQIMAMGATHPVILKQAMHVQAGQHLMRMTAMIYVEMVSPLELFLQPTAMMETQIMEMVETQLVKLKQAIYVQEVQHPMLMTVMIYVEMASPLGLFLLPIETMETQIMAMDVAVLVRLKQAMPVLVAALLMLMTVMTHVEMDTLMELWSYPIETMETLLMAMDVAVLVRGNQIMNALEVVLPHPMYEYPALLDFRLR